MDYIDNIIKNIKYLRKETGLSQVDFAKIAKVSQATINRWEKNQMSPTINNLFYICEHFNVNIGDLICKDLSLNYSDKITKSTADNSVKLIIDKTKPITAETVVEVQKTLMDEMNDNKDNKT